MEVNAVQALVARVQQESRNMADSIATERGAKVTFLACLVEVLKEALPAICSRVPYEEVGKASEYGRTGADTAWFTGPLERALLISGSERPVPPTKKIEGVEPMTGKGLYLTQDGRFFAVEFGGQFKNIGTTDEYRWFAQARELTPEKVVEERWSLEDIAANVADELEIQIAGKTKAAAKADRVTARVRECAILLKGIR